MVDVSKYFSKKGNSTIFVGEKMEILISENYKKYDILSVTDVLTCVGVFDLNIYDGSNVIQKGWFMPGIVRVHPSEITSVTIGEDRYVKAILKKGDIFLEANNVVKNPRLAYLIFLEFIYLGKHPRWLNYVNTPFVFDTVAKICGIKFPVNHVVFEMIYSHLYRDANDVGVFYRLTDMTTPPQVIPLRAVAHATTSTSSKILIATSYFNDNVDSALVNKNDEPNELEQLLRR